MKWLVLEISLYSLSCAIADIEIIRMKRGTDELFYWNYDDVSIRGNNLSATCYRRGETQISMKWTAENRINNSVTTFYCKNGVIFKKSQKNNECVLELNYTHSYINNIFSCHGGNEIIQLFQIAHDGSHDEPKSAGIRNGPRANVTIGGKPVGGEEEFSPCVQLQATCECTVFDNSKYTEIKWMLFNEGDGKPQCLNNITSNTGSVTSNLELRQTFSVQDDGKILYCMCNSVQSTYVTLKLKNNHLCPSTIAPSINERQPTSDRAPSSDSELEERQSSSPLALQVALPLVLITLVVVGACFVCRSRYARNCAESQSNTKGEPVTKEEPLYSVPIPSSMRIKKNDPTVIYTELEHQKASVEYSRPKETDYAQIVGILKEPIPTQPGPIQSNDIYESNLT